MENITKFIDNSKKFLVKHSPEILTGLGISSMIFSTILAVKATPKAIKKMDKLEKDSNEDVKIKDTIKAVWLDYMPAAGFCLSGIVLIVCGCKISSKRSAALATAYAVSERTLRTYKDKVIETIGEKKEQDIQQKVSQVEIDKNPPENTKIFITKKGDTLIKDNFSGRYFKGDLDSIRKSINELNKRMFNENYISLNEYYLNIGLETIEDGYQLGWNIEKGLIDINIDACLTSDEEPCLCISFNKMPEPNFA